MSKDTKTSKYMLSSMKNALERNHEFCTPEHLLSILLEEEIIKDVFDKIDVNIDTVNDKLEEHLSGGFIDTVSSGVQPAPSPLFEELIMTVSGKSSIGVSMGGASISQMDTSIFFLIQLIGGIPPSYESTAQYILLDSGVNMEELARYIHNQMEDSLMGGGHGGSDKINNKADAEKYMSKYATNLNKLAKDGKIDPLIGRTDEVSQAIQILCRKKKNNPVLVGESGVGKTAIAEGIALHVSEGNVPNVMKNTTLWSLNLGSLLAGTKFRGDFEERIALILKSLKFLDEPILFIDEIHMIMGAGSSSGQGGGDAANLLKPSLSDGSLRCIGSTTFDEYRQNFEKDPALSRRFGRVKVDEPSVSEAKEILKGLRKVYEDHHKVTYTETALDAAVDLSQRYINRGLLPDKAIDIMDKVGARAVMNDEVGKVIDLYEIEQEVLTVAKIPEESIRDDTRTKLMKLSSKMSSNVFGQEQAVEVLTDAVYMAQAGLRDNNKPEGSYLFAGPTGVGKTEIARTLSDVLGIPLIKFDMSEYMEQHSVSKLIGAPPGYVGFSDTGSGLLTNKIDENPYCVLLLDEIEKAHPSIYNILLQVMDDGRLTNSSGKVVSFRNVILIMTTNAGASALEKKSIGFGDNMDSDDMAEIMNEALKKVFTPEFRNRLDAIVPFNKLSEEIIEMVASKFTNSLTEDVLRERKIVLTIQPEVLKWLAKDGYDPLMGARPMQRTIDNNIKKPLSRLIINDGLTKDDTVEISIVDNEIILVKK